MGDDEMMAHVKVQWRDSDCCFHLTCDCGAETHYDVPAREQLMCRSCLRTYRLPDELSIGEAVNNE